MAAILLHGHSQDAKDAKVGETKQNARYAVEMLVNRKSKPARSTHEAGHIKRMRGGAAELSDWAGPCPLNTC